MAFTPSRPPNTAGPTPIARLMSRLMARTGYDRERAAEGLEEAWRQVVSGPLLSGSQPGLVRRGVLDVFVSHSALVQEVGFQKRDLVARLTELVPTAGISDIRCRLQADVGRRD